MTAGAYARLAGRAVPRGTESCDMCGAAVPANHDHLLDAQQAQVRCSCRACRLLFEREAASGGRYRPIPRRRLRVPDVDVRALGVPVGLAYLVRDAAGAAHAHYPSPLGATRWDVDGERWAAATASCSELATLRPEVEALLVNTARGAKERWIVPIDDCFRLVAVVRREWRGLSGGVTVWPAIDEFFADLASKEAPRG